uniref:Secreted protein n=1 Tax=Panagrellus redivivus TaxID=6233 RepID=A0A7E4VUU1_PANRE
MRPTMKISWTTFMTVGNVVLTENHFVRASKTDENCFRFAKVIQPTFEAVSNTTFWQQGRYFRQSFSSTCPFDHRAKVV